MGTDGQKKLMHRTYRKYERKGGNLKPKHGVLEKIKQIHRPRNSHKHQRLRYENQNPEASECQE